MTVATWKMPSVGSPLAAAKQFGPAIGVACGCAAAAVLPIGDDDGTVLCPFRLATGGWCPGCVATRAFRAMTHLDLGRAFTLNPWAILVLAQAIVFTSWLATAPESFRAWWDRFDMRVLSVNVTIALSFWVIRMALDQIPLPFA